MIDSCHSNCLIQVIRYVIQPHNDPTEETRPPAECSGAAPETAGEPRLSSVLKPFSPCAARLWGGQSLLTHWLGKYTLLQTQGQTETRQDFQKTKPLNSNTCLKNTRFTETWFLRFSIVLFPLQRSQFPEAKLNSRLILWRLFNDLLQTEILPECLRKHINRNLFPQGKKAMLMRSPMGRVVRQPECGKLRMVPLAWY